jgi:hypothetical protein
MACRGSRAQGFRARARKLRKAAEECQDEKLKQQFEIVAQEYEKLARMVDEGKLHA